MAADRMDRVAASVSGIAGSMTDKAAEKAAAVADQIIGTVFIWTNGTLVVFAVLLALSGWAGKCLSKSVILSALLGIVSIVLARGYSLLETHLFMPGMLMGMATLGIAQLILIVVGAAKMFLRRELRIAFEQPLRKIIREELALTNRS
jgi:hypothetical protein